jgi:hypothetical protein
VSATDTKTDSDILSLAIIRRVCLDGARQSSSGHRRTPDRVAGLARQRVATAGR